MNSCIVIRENSFGLLPLVTQWGWVRCCLSPRSPAPEAGGSAQNLPSPPSPPEPLHIVGASDPQSAPR